MNNRNQTTKIIAVLSGHVLFGRELPENYAAGTDWGDVLRECGEQGIASVFSDEIGQIPLPAEVYQNWAMQSIFTMRHAMQLLAVQTELIDALDAAGVSYAVLKGYASAQYYPKAYYRMLGDIDVLIEPEHFERAMRAAQAAGFSNDAPEKSFSRHEVLHKDGIEVEMHRFFAVTEKETPEDRFLNSTLLKALRDTHTVFVNDSGEISDEQQGNAFRSLPDYENGTVLLQHMNQHLSEGIGYRQLFDFLVYAERCLNDAAWEGHEGKKGFREAAAAIGLEKLAKVTVRMGQLFFGLTESITWCRDAEEELCDALFDYIGEKGNLGAKQSEANSATAKALTLGRGSLLARLRYEQASGMAHWKAAGRHKILRPFAWIYGICHHIRALLKAGGLRTWRQDRDESRKQAELLDALGVHAETARMFLNQE